MVSKTEGTGTTQYVWDFGNRLTQVVTPSSGSVTYKYDGLGRRIQRTPSSGVSTNFIYDGQDVVKDINSDGTTVEYLNGPGIDNKIRQKGSSTSTTYYFSQDHLSSTTALTGITGKLVERITYDAYGNSAGSTRTRYGYTGRERDPLTGLLYYRARFYDPQLGHFISEDPIGLVGGINAYAYVENNPLRFADPSGLCTEKSTPEPCDLTAPTDKNERAVAETLMGEATAAGSPQYGDDQRGSGAVGHASLGVVPRGAVRLEEFLMVSVIENRARATGTSWFDVVNAKQRNGNFQFEGYPNGQNYINQLGAKGSDMCERLRGALDAINAVKLNGPNNRFGTFMNWRGIAQGTFIRARQGAFRIAGTDFF